jgi:hypothetical protein
MLARGMVKVVEPLHNKQEPPSSNPNTTNTKNKIAINHYSPWQTNKGAKGIMLNYGEH